MDYLQAIILGLTQGLTEFLPVSSSGHLVVAQKFLQIPTHNVAFDVAVHLGTLLTILSFYFRPIKKIFQEIWHSIRTKEINFGITIGCYIFLASLPTAALGFGFKDQFEALFSNLSAVVIFFSITGGLLFLTKIKGNKSQLFSAEAMSDLGGLNWWKAILIGVAQGLAIAPGISRAGTTIAMALLLGVRPSTAALFSFLISIPAVLGAGLLQLRGAEILQGDSIYVTGVGFLTAYISGLFGLWLVLQLLSKSRLHYFSYYLWALAASMWFFQLS